MPTAPYSLTRLQLGWESTPGTPIAATKLLIGNGTFTPQQEIVAEDYARGIRGHVLGDEVKVWQGAEVEFETTLNAEELLYALQTGIVEDAAPTGAGPYTWAFPASMAAVPTLKSLTGEFVFTDGSTDHYKAQVAGMRTRQIVITLAGQEKAMLKFTMFGKAAVRSFTPATGLTAQTGRTPLASLGFGAYINNSWAALGTTQKTGLVRTATLTINTGVEPDWTLDGDPNLSFTAYKFEQLSGTLAMGLSLNADAGVEKDAWYDRTSRFIRLEYDNGAAGAANRQILLDVAGRYESIGVSRAGETMLLDANLKLGYDTTGAQAFLATVINGLAAVA